MKLCALLKLHFLTRQCILECKNEDTANASVSQSPALVRRKGFNQETGPWSIALWYVMCKY